MSQYLRPNIILLKQGTDSSQGSAQVISNINACAAVVDIVRTTLGPRGTDKMMIDGQGGTTITNDGATVIKNLNISHPAASVLTSLAQSQDKEMGDGTTSVCILAGAFLDAAKAFITNGVHPAIIMKGFRLAESLACDRLNEIAKTVDTTPESRRDLLIKCGETTLNSKLISDYKTFFAGIIVDACMCLEDDLPIDMIGMKLVPGGSVTDSFLVRGVAFKKCFSYAGFEQQPKKFVGAKVLALQIELELQSEKENAEVRITDPKDFQSIVDAEWTIIYGKCEAIVKTGAQVVLSKMAIGDVATQYFSDRGIFCAGRVSDEDMQRVCSATGARLQSTTHRMDENVLGHCGVFEEVQLGSERYNLFKDCPNAHSATLILRGGAEQFLQEAQRSCHDAIMIVRRAMKNSKVVGGGGAVEMDLSKTLREAAKTIPGKAQFMVEAYAKALEVIPQNLSLNSGLDVTRIMNELRQAHCQPDSTWIGVDCLNGGLQNTWDNFVWEPKAVKEAAIKSATEGACLILSIDETVKVENNQEGPAGMPALKGKGKGKGR